MDKQSKMILLQQVGCGSSGLGHASKMPCATYSLPASRCIVGQKLAKVAGSVCEGCYADGRGNYRWSSVQHRLNERWKSIQNAEWVPAMIELIRTERNPYFRWHDSGDLQSVDHLDKINQIALALPEVKFWLPTRELGIVQSWLKQNEPAPNLIIRLSTHMINQRHVGRVVTKAGRRLPVSYVHTGVAARVKGTNVCPAPKQDGKCADCRNCWDDTKDVSYAKH